MESPTEMNVIFTTRSQKFPAKPGASNAPSKFFMKSGALPLPWM